ncbi:MAG: YqgE/AlgH family protein [Rhizobiales bacterium]|nr:YqgE/AlgH family protein [Hyphomicrobiales bacterium]MBI3673606.1 YqgE/AlgH family protein [Hyphomicrobiales bacterium]
MKPGPYLDGQMLIAMPGMSDPRFDHSLIYLCVHSEGGAMGIIVNKLAPMMTFADLVSRLDITPGIAAAEGAEDVFGMPVQFGGPVEPGRGFVLHTSDYFSPESSLPVSERVALTATLDILRAMATGQGPHRALLALGYSGWAPGQLESEIQRNGWLNCEADEELLFGASQDEKYERALRKIGVDPAMLSSDAGHG